MEPPPPLLGRTPSEMEAKWNALLTRAWAGDAAAALEMLVLAENTPSPCMELVATLLTHAPVSMGVLVQFCHRAGPRRALCRCAGFVQMCLEYCSGMMGDEHATCALWMLTTLAEDLDNRGVLFATAGVVSTVLLTLTRNRHKPGIMREAMALLHVLAGEGNLVQVDGFIACMVDLLARKDQRRRRGRRRAEEDEQEEEEAEEEEEVTPEAMRAMDDTRVVLVLQLLDDVLQDAQNSMDVFRSDSSRELVELLCGEVQRNAHVQWGGGGAAAAHAPRDAAAAAVAAAAEEEDYSIRELSLTVLATLAMENGHNLLTDALLEFYARVTGEDLAAGVDLYPLMVTFSRLCEDHSNCHRMFNLAGFVLLLIECANAESTTTESKSFILRNLVKLVLSQERSMISSSSFPVLFNWFLATSQLGETMDIRATASTVLKIAHCLLADVFVARAPQLVDEEEACFWANLPRAHVMLSVRTVQRIGARSSLRRMPVDLTRLVFQMLNG